MEFQSSQNKQNLQNIFLKKYHAGQIYPERAKTAQIWPRSREESGAVVAFEPASWAWLSAALGDRIGISRFRPSD
jgi:hypothetical protein